MFHNQTVERLRPLSGQVPAGDPVELPQRDAGIDEIASICLFLYLARMSGQLPYQFLQDVFQGNQSLDIAVFVHHQGKPLVVLLEIHQRLVQKHVLGHEVYFLKRLA